jgi:hypothetical protein
LDIFQYHDGMLARIVVEDVLQLQHYKPSISINKCLHRP